MIYLICMLCHIQKRGKYIWDLIYDAWHSWVQDTHIQNVWILDVAHDVHGHKDMIFLDLKFD